MLVSTKAVCEYKNVEESHVFAQTLSNNISESVGPIFKLCSLLFAEWSICDNGGMLVSTKVVFEYINVEESNVIA